MGAENTKKEVWSNKFTKMAEESERMIYCILRIENFVNILITIDYEA